MANYSRWWEWGTDYMEFEDGEYDARDTGWDETLDPKADTMLRTTAARIANREYYERFVLRCRLLDEWGDIVDEGYAYVDHETLTLPEAIYPTNIKIPQRFHRELARVIAAR